MMTARSIYDDAIAKKAWVYFKETKQWFTPEEFLQEFAMCHPDHPTLKACLIRDPRKALGTGFIELSTLQRKLNEFSLRVVNYYGK